MLRDRISEMVEYIAQNASYIDRNKQALEIYEGDLIDKVRAVLKKTLSKEYYSTIEDRVIPINFMPRFIGKMSQVYMLNPVRACEQEQSFIDDYSKWMDVNAVMQLADEYSNLFKGYALEPYVDHKGKPSLRVLPFTDFLVMGDDPSDKKRPTVFIKFMGEYCKTKSFINGKTRSRFVTWYIAYTNDEIVAFDFEKEERTEISAMTDGVNPIGMIPFVYGNRSKRCLLPIQDTDLVQMVKMFPVLFSDLGGAIMYSCFSVIYTVDVDTSDIKLSPNALWDFKSNPQSEKAPQVGTIKPQADIEQVITFLRNIMGSWAESRSIKVGSLGSLDGASMASGLSKIVDNMDTYEVVKKAIPSFKKEEKELWELLSLMNNHWLKTGEISTDHYPTSIVNTDEIINQFAMHFDEPKQQEDRTSMVTTQVLELNNGLTSRRRAIAKVNPEATIEEVETILEEINQEQGE